MTSRRRVLTILAGAAALPVLGTPAQSSALTSAQTSAQTKSFGHWRGIALGAEAGIYLDHPDAERLIAKSVAEIRRLEAIFSLYRADSQLARLNRQGFLKNPAFEMIELLSICSGLHRRTNGAFDPTVQTLWSLYATAISAGAPPDPNQILQALDVTGWRHMRYSPQEVRFAKQGISVTLNGIAQGYIADRITNILRQADVENVLVNTGEIAAIGVGPSGDNWQVRLGDRDGIKISLRNSAVATSAPLATTFDASGKIGHILDPRTGSTPGLWRQVSVLSKTAAEADGLSTAFCLMHEPEIAKAKGRASVFL